MTCLNWQLEQPISAVIFDYDGTLTKLEGINELAKRQGVYQQIVQITENAMAKTGLNPTIYKKRLDLIKPQYQHVVDLGSNYFIQQVPDVLQVIKILKRLNKHIFLLSAGVNPAVTQFGLKLNIDKENIFAVDLQFDENGNYVDFDHSSPLIFNSGKGKIISNIKQLYSELIYVGDGMNDIIAKKFVRRLIGYGGVFYRTSIKKAADFYIPSLSMAPLLLFTLTVNEAKTLLPFEKKLYQKGMHEWQILKKLHA